jgi:hypothetical protein
MSRRLTSALPFRFPWRLTVAASIAALFLPTSPQGRDLNSGPYAVTIGEPHNFVCSASDTILQQLPDGFDGLASQRDPCFPDFVTETADDFLGDGNLITGVAWWGVYTEGEVGSPEAFEITIYARDVDGCPGDSLFSYSTVAFNETIGDPNSYCVVFPNPFITQNGVTYSVSIQAVMCWPPQWFWATGSGNGSESCFRSEFFGHPDWVPSTTAVGAPYDHAFVLYSGSSMPPFAVVDTDPPSNDVGAIWWPGPTIEAIFSRPVLPEDVTEETFRVRGLISGPASKSLEISDDSLSVTLEPFYGLYRGFAAGELVEAGIISSVRSSQGDTLTSPRIWHFRTFANRGTGEFEDIPDLVAGFGAVTLAPGDMNDDGKTDLVTATTQGKLRVYINTTPEEGDSLTYQETFINRGMVLTSLSLQDLDEDGLLDIAVSDQEENVIHIGRNLGAGTSYQWMSWPVCDAPQKVVAGDINGDGHVDLCTACEATFYTPDAGDEVNVLFGDGAGGVLDVGSYSLGGEPFDLALRDANLDGLLDLVVLQRIENHVTVLLNQGPSVSADSVFTVVTTAAAVHPRGFLVEDLDQDRRPDVIVADGKWVAVYKMLPDGDLAGAAYHDAGVADSDSLRAVTAFDFDGDDDLDVAVTVPAADRWEILENEGGVLSHAGGYGTQSQPINLEGVDLDRNGIMDIAVVTRLGPGWLDLFLGVRNPSDVAEEPASSHVAHLTGRPNPFLGRVTFDLPQGTIGALQIFDVSGRLVRRLEGGFTSRQIEWDGRDHLGRHMASGQYLVRFQGEQAFKPVRVIKLD